MSLSAVQDAVTNVQAQVDAHSSTLDDLDGLVSDLSTLVTAQQASQSSSTSTTTQEITNNNTTNVTGVAPILLAAPISIFTGAQNAPIGWTTFSLSAGGVPAGTKAIIVQFFGEWDLSGSSTYPAQLLSRINAGSGLTQVLGYIGGGLGVTSGNFSFCAPTAIVWIDSAANAFDYELSAPGSTAILAVSNFSVVGYLG